MSVDLEVAWDRPSSTGSGSHWLSVQLERLRGSAALPAVAVLVDTSSSMLGRRLAHAKEALAALARALSERQALAVWGFASEVRPVFQGVGGRDISGPLEHLEAAGRTCLDRGLDAAAAWLAPQGGGELLLLTDGAPTTTEGRRAPTEPLLERVRSLGRAGVRCSTVGLGDASRYDAGFLRALADATGGVAVSHASAEQAQEALLGLLRVQQDERAAVQVSLDSGELELREAWRVWPRVQPLPVEGQAVSLTGGVSLTLLLRCEYRSPVGAVRGRRAVGRLCCALGEHRAERALFLNHVLPSSEERFALNVEVDALRARVELARTAELRSQRGPEEQLRLTRRLSELAEALGDPRATARIDQELGQLEAGGSLDAQALARSVDALRGGDDG